MYWNPFSYFWSIRERSWYEKLGTFVYECMTKSSSYVLFQATHHISITIIIFLSIYIAYLHLKQRRRGRPIYAQMDDMGGQPSNNSHQKAGIKSNSGELSLVTESTEEASDGHSTQQLVQAKQQKVKASDVSNNFSYTLTHVITPTPTNDVEGLKDAFTDLKTKIIEWKDSHAKEPSPTATSSKAGPTQSAISTFNPKRDDVETWISRFELFT